MFLTYCFPLYILVIYISYHSNLLAAFICNFSSKIISFWWWLLERKVEISIINKNEASCYFICIRYIGYNMIKFCILVWLDMKIFSLCSIWCYFYRVFFLNPQLRGFPWLCMIIQLGSFEYNTYDMGKKSKWITQITI